MGEQIFDQVRADGQRSQDAQRDADRREAALGEQIAQAQDVGWEVREVQIVAGLPSAALRYDITSPRAHGLRGLSWLDADIPTDTLAREAWMREFNAALDERAATTDADELLRKIVEAEAS